MQVWIGPSYVPLPWKGAIRPPLPNSLPSPSPQKAAKHNLITKSTHSIKLCLPQYIQFHNYILVLLQMILAEKKKNNKKNKERCFVHRLGDRQQNVA